MKDCEQIDMLNHDKEHLIVNVHHVLPIVQFQKNGLITPFKRIMMDKIMNEMKQRHRWKNINKFIVSALHRIHSVELNANQIFLSSFHSWKWSKRMNFDRKKTESIEWNEVQIKVISLCYCHFQLFFFCLTIQRMSVFPFSMHFFSPFLFRLFFCILLFWYFFKRIFLSIEHWTLT